MYTLIFFAVLLVFAVPFFLLAWWLKRSNRSLSHLVDVVNEYDVDLGEIRIGGQAQEWLMFADVRFVLFLVLGRYRDLELPLVVKEALDQARKDYLTSMAVSTTLIVIVFGVVLYDRI